MNIARILILPLLTCAGLSAQFTSAIQGVVFDSSGAVIPGATVHVTNRATGIERKAVASGEGLYRVLTLGAGAYRVEATADGFSKMVRESVALADGETVRVDFTMQPGALAESVVVTAETADVETEQGRVSGRLQSAVVDRLPMNGRNVFNILALQAGVTGRGRSAILGGGSGTTGSDSFAGELQPEMNAAGQRSESNSFKLDNSSLDSVARGGVTNLTPSADSIEEVRVTVSNFSAVEGQASGAQVQIVTKSGTNAFHGSASYYFQNNTLSARNTFESGVPVFRKNQFTYTVSGPIIKNRTFFFHSYEGLRGSGNRASLFNVETEQFRDFVSRTRPNSIAAKLLTDFQPLAYPVTNLRDLGSPARGVNVIGPVDGVPDLGTVSLVPEGFRTGNQFSFRVDHELVPGKDRLYGSYYRTSTASLAGQARSEFNRPTDEDTSYAGLNHTHIFSATRINELKFGVMRLVGGPRPPEHLEIPTINITQVSAGFPLGLFPSGWAQTNFNLKEVYSWIASSHTFKFGGELTRRRSNARNTQSYVPQYSFASLLDFADDEALQMSRTVDPATGEPVSTVSGERLWEWSGFINDDWKVTPNLTLNLGLRYDNFGTVKEVNGLLRGLVFGPGNSYPERMAKGRMDVLPEFYPVDRNNFAPRVGVAWNPGGKGKVAIRGGYGVSYDRIFTTPVGQYRNNPPLRAVATLGPQLGTSFTYTLGDVSKPGLGYPIEPGLTLGLDANNFIRGSRVAIRTLDPNIRTPYSHNWFFGLQRAIGGGLVAEANYIGVAGHRLFNLANVNRYAGDMLDGRFDGLNYGLSQVLMMEASSNSVYHGGNLQVRKQFNRGLLVQAAYTFGKTLTDADSVVNTTNYQNAANRSLDRGPADFNVSSKLSFVGVWEFPFLKADRSLPGRILGGWQLSGSAIFQSGLPFTVVHGAPWPRGDFNADGTNGDRPNAPMGDYKTGGWTNQEFLSGIFPVSAFPLPAAGMDGTLGRNTFRGPGFAQIDASLNKQFRVTERVSAELRFDVFNALNRVNLNNPSADLNSATFGRSTSALDPRQFQAGMRVRF